MGYKAKQSKVINSRTDFVYYAFRNILLVALPLTLISALTLSLPHSSATGSGTDRIEFSLSVSCTLSSVVNNEHSASINSGTYTSGVGKTTVTTLCNDGNGYAVYANGYSNNEEGNNKLINSTYPQYSIDTGLSTSGLTSQWAMKLNNIENDSSPTPPVIGQDYNNTYGIVPNYWTKVAYRQSGTTDMAQGSSFTTTYAVYASSSQYTGTYQGQVKYLLTHPYSNSQYLGFNEAFAADNKNIITIDGNSYYAMQDMNSDICNTVKLMGEASATQLVDIRDNKLYWIAKLADGHCWMTQNLDFDIVADEQDPTKMKTLTSEDTDLTDHSLTGAYIDGYSYDSATGITSWTPAISAKTINFVGGNGVAIPSWVHSNTTPNSASKTDVVDASHASLGNYYNWTAAIASNDSSTLFANTYSNIANNPRNSICPKGWRLPTISNQPNTMSGSTNEFARLNYLYNNNKTDTDAGMIMNPLYFMRGGYIYNNSLDQLGNIGRYNSSTSNNSVNNYHLSFSNNLVETERVGNSTKKVGASIRCIAR